MEPRLSSVAKHLAIAALCLGLGIGIGGHLTGPAHADGPAAGTSPYTECFAARTWSEQGSKLASGKLPERRVAVPPGWTPIGGGGSGGAEPHIILCR